MTAKTKHGFHGGHHTKGADHGTTHERLMRQHRRPGRAEGAPLNGAQESSPMPSSASSNPLQMAGPETGGEMEGSMPGGEAQEPPGAEPDDDGDDTEGDQT